MNFFSQKSVRFQPDSTTGGGIRSYFSAKNLGIILVIVVLGIVGYYFYKSATTKPPSDTEHYSSNSSGSSTGKESEIILFYADWCPHCKTAKPEWEQVKAEYNGKTVNGYTLLFTEVNCTNESADVERMMNTYKIEGFPTIKLIKDNQVVDFDAKPTKSTLTQFINTVV
jgi:thiol-disulfide isomerase/thioredoxin